MNPSNPIALSGPKTAVITGAGTGIGAAIAHRISRLGWKVVLAGRTQSTLAEVAASIAAAGGQAVAVPCDVTVSADVARVIDAAGPRLDALIHSAGVGHCLTIDELDEVEWRQTLDVAVTGAFLTAKLALPKLRASQGGDGHIIEVCSLASGGTWNREVGYGTAKGAQLKFALHLASQMKDDAAKGGRTIHVHAVCPGTVDTPFWDRVPNRAIDRNLALRADEVAWLVSEIIQQPNVSIVELVSRKPRKEVVVKPHSPFERWNNVIAIAHESHP
ncbi:MAG TPA: SDR family oxidoreductase [Lacunisphaera sp.]|nr:SDR family oxidoreductase [Lacunisphaera sp.]